MLKFSLFQIRDFQLELYLHLNTNQMSKSPTLICIPDISGFTQFMSETDSDLAFKVIPSLLNNIIYSNTIDLKVSEIEGDAILFFKMGKLPDIKSLVKQCDYFYSEFYNQLYKLQDSLKKNSSTPVIPDILGLKIILHFGKEVDAVQIGNRIKLMGEDVIIAHRLLKNDIEQDEYLLFSQALLDQYDSSDLKEAFKEKTFKKGMASYEHIGDVAYQSIELIPHKKTN